MATTAKRITLALTKTDLVEIENLKKIYSDTMTQVIKRAIWELHQKHYPEFKHEMPF